MTHLSRKSTSFKNEIRVQTEEVESKHPGIFAVELYDRIQEAVTFFPTKTEAQKRLLQKMHSIDAIKNPDDMKNARKQFSEEVLMLAALEWGEKPNNYFMRGYAAKEDVLQTSLISKSKQADLERHRQAPANLKTVAATMIALGSVAAIGNGLQSIIPDRKPAITHVDDHGNPIKKEDSSKRIKGFLAALLLAGAGALVMRGANMQDITTRAIDNLDAALEQSKESSVSL